MKNIFNSASKLVFLLIAIAVIVGMFLGKVDAKDFMVLASMAFTFYFTRDKGSDSSSDDDSSDTATTDTTTTPAVDTANTATASPIGDGSSNAS